MKKIPITNHPDLFAIVDDEDFARVSKLKWYLVRVGKSKYVQSKSRVGVREYDGLYLRRFVLGLGVRAGGYVRTLNGDFLDNRKENLRCS